MASVDKNGMSQDDMNIQMWKVKRLVKSLDAARGAGTSMISLILVR